MDDPYTNKYGVLNYSLSSPEIAPSYHVQQMRIVPARTGGLDNDALKKAILEFGGLYATMKLYSPYYATVYQYDTLGLINCFVKASSAYAANIFTATEDGNLDAVGFYAIVPFEPYTVSVYTRCSSSNPESGSKMLEQSGKCDKYAGSGVGEKRQECRFWLVVREREHDAIGV